MFRCPFVFVSGKYKGQTCGTKLKPDTTTCARHAKCKGTTQPGARAPPPDESPPAIVPAVSAAKPPRAPPKKGAPAIKRIAPKKGAPELTALDRINQNIARDAMNLGGFNIKYDPTHYDRENFSKYAMKKMRKQLQTKMKKKLTDDEYNNMSLTEVKKIMTQGAIV